eukprot:12808573-Ditylum_brightwellii.AAC.1
MKKIYDMLEDQASRYGWAEFMMNVLNGPNDNPKTVTKKLLTQFASLSLDDLKRHANQYFLGGENLNGVPDKAAMIVANIDPANNTMYKRCYY